MTQTESADYFWSRLPSATKLNLKRIASRPVKSILRRVGYELAPFGPPRSMREKNPDITDREWSIYSSVSRLTMISMERIIANIRAIDYVSKAGIPGDIVECGVWRGGSVMAMALALKDRAVRNLWLYDTFAGMTDPTESDVSCRNSPASQLLAAAKAHERAENSLVWAFASLEDVRANIRSTGYPEDKITFVRGPVEETIPAIIPNQIAVLRLDTDWYESTRHELEHLYPLLSPGGLLIIDDYGDWQGCKKAVDEYFHAKPVFLNRIDYTGRLLVKPI